MRRSNRWRVVGVALITVALVAFASAWDRSSQPGRGDGWSLLARQRGVAGYAPTLVIDGQSEFDAAWDGMRLLGDPPPPTLDWNATAVFWFTATGSIGCPSRLDRIGIDPDRHVVAAEFSLGLTAGCDHAVVPDSFVVAVDRGRLPAPPYSLEIVGP